jgi:hypothetical protein
MKLYIEALIFAQLHFPFYDKVLGNLKTLRHSKVYNMLKEQGKVPL